MTSTSSAPAYIRWEQGLPLQLICAAMPRVQAGEDLVEVVHDLQGRYLEPERRKSIDTLEDWKNTKQAKDAIASYKTLAATARAEQVEALRKRVERNALIRREATMVATGRESAVKWTELEWALLRRRVHYFKVDLGDHRGYALLYRDAQVIELPPERWRNANSLWANACKTGNNGGCSLVVRYEHPAKNVAELLAPYPFNPAQKSCARVPEPAPLVQPPTEVKPPPETPPAPETVVQPPKSLRQLAEEGRQRMNLKHPERIEGKQAQERAESAQASTPPPPAENRHGDPIRRFGEAFATGMADLMDAVTTKCIAEMEQRVRQVSEVLIMKAMDRIDQRMQQMVKASLEKELGGGIDVPDVDLGPIPDMTGDGLERGIKLDIIGLHGAQVAEVKRAMNGYADSIRFLPVDKLDAWAPRSIVLINARMGLGAAERKCTGQRVTIHRYWGTAASALKIISGIYAAQGLPLPH